MNQENSMPIELYTDGSSLRNPGASGYAYIIRYYETAPGTDFPEVKTIEQKQGYRLSTNNRMEMMAVIVGLKDILTKSQEGFFQDSAQVQVMSDSEYVIKAINQHWVEKWASNHWMTSGYQGSQPKPVKNQDLWEEILAIKQQYHTAAINLTFQQIPGHSGIEWNERADQLAVSASKDGNSHLIDEWYEKTTPVYNKG